LEAVLLLRRGRPEDLQAALDLLQQLVTEPRDATPEDRLLLGRLQERLGNLPAAEEQFKQLADAQPAAARHLAAYVDFLLRRPRLEEARAYLEQLERAAPISLTAVSLRSRLLLATGQAEQIDNYLESFAQTQLSQLHDAQQRQQFMLQVAGLFASVNRPAGAERWYRRLVAEFPQQRNALANFWMQNNQLPQSLEFAMSEVQQEATPATAALLARVLVRGDAEPAQLERAESIFRDVLQHSPDDADLLFSLASLRLKQNQLADAEQLLRQLTQRHPDHVIAWNNLAAILADDPERLAEAVTCIDRAIAAAGRPVANLLDTKAVILLRQDQNQEAAELLRQVLSLAGNVDPRFHFHLAVAQFRQGDLTSAKQAWQRAVQLGLDGAYLTGFERQLAAEMSAALTDPPAAAQGGA
jgi:tetratricopeptide (TPR) repeat protein